MSGITASNARMEAGKPNSLGAERPMFDISTSHVSGYACTVRFYQKWNYVLILKCLKDENQMVLVSIPSPEWENDLMTEFEDYEIVQRFYEVKNAYK